MNGDYSKDQLIRSFANRHGFKLAFPHNYWPLAHKIEEVMVMGILRGSGEILEHAWSTGKRTYYLDHGYFQGWAPELRYRLCVNGLFTIPRQDPPADRARKMLGWLKPQRVRKGESVIICAQTQPFLKICGYEDWIGHATQIAAQKFPGAPTIWRHKNFSNKGALLNDRIENHFHNARALITCASSAAVKSLYYGLETITDPRYITNAFDGDYDKFTRQIAYCEYTEAELGSGAAKELADYISGI